MKKLLVSITSLFFVFNLAYGQNYYALFSPHQGKKAFEEVYKLVAKAKKSVKISIYSWSDNGIDKAMALALKNKASVRIVVHPPLLKKKAVITKIAKLEKIGAEVKVATMKMHEKMIIVDNQNIINTSANMSGGAKSRYSENFVFMTDLNKADKILNDFIHEFTVLWNSSIDLQTHNEGLSAELNEYTKVSGSKILNIPSKGNPVLYSSSMNFNITEASTNDINKGRFIRLKSKKVSNKKTWIIRDMLIEQIKKAKQSILLNLNHFYLDTLLPHLANAIKRGVKVAFMVDNQEFKTTRTPRESTPKFVQMWNKSFSNLGPAPVRIKYYSHAPSPRFWYLNHHKYLLIDYSESGNDTTLITGSYNLSQTAELSQFDNMVVYSGGKFKKLHKAFKQEFMSMWHQNRTSEDKPSQKILKALTYVNEKGNIALHYKEPISLTWKEAMKVKAAVAKKAKGIFNGIFRKRNCFSFNVNTQKFNCAP